MSSQTVATRGLPPGRDYLVMTIGLSQDAGINITKDEIWAGQGFTQPTISVDLSATPAASLQLQCAATNNLTGFDEFWLTNGESFVGLPGPWAVYSAFSSWGNNDVTALSEALCPWFLNEEESGAGFMILYCQADNLLEDGILNHEIEIRFYPNRANEILLARNVI
tara:strand:- start:10940 stop:11437 length:498 start_codon:yes stop_codon:yes gene_type:complete